MSKEEIIGGYKLHPAAAVFPLIEGDDFDYLVESIIHNGVQHPIVVCRLADGDLLIDGRNRLRAVEVAREQGHTINVPIVEWVEDGRNVAQWIWDTNAIRRQMGDEGLAMASAAISPMIAEENRQRQKASQFKTGVSGNPDGKKQVDTKSCPPAKRDIKAKHEASTVGQVAAKAGTTKHKARQAIEVQRAIDSGELPADTAKHVIAGKTKLRDAAKQVGKTSKRKKLREKREKFCVALEKNKIELERLKKPPEVSPPPAAVTTADEIDRVRISDAEREALQAAFGALQDTDAEFLELSQADYDRLIDTLRKLFDRLGVAR